MTSAAHAQDMFRPAAFTRVRNRGTRMQILCRAGWHKASDQGLWNNGYYFSQCQHCSAPLIRQPTGRWKGVPPGYKIVWKPRTDSDIDWTAWSAAQGGKDELAAFEEADDSGWSGHLRPRFR